MKTIFNALFASLGLLLAGQAAAQNLGDDLTVLYSFPTISDGDNNGGAYPTSGLAASGNMLYGFTAAGGLNGSGTLFAVSTNGTGFADLYDFDDPLPEDGMDPKFGIMMAGNVIYGTTYEGGSAGSGSVFSIHADGSGYTLLHDFLDDQAYLPIGALVLSGDTLYGTTYGGHYGYGAVFSVKTDGSDFTILHSFQSQATVDEDGDYVPDPFDGADPMGSLVLSPEGDELYGTTTSGGFWGGGTVFALPTAVDDIVLLYSFPPNLTEDAEAVGSEPVAGLLMSPDGGMLYGTTYYGGEDNLGTVFSIDAGGEAFNVLHQFEPIDMPGWQSQLSYAQVISPLIFSRDGSLLYGSSIVGGNSPVIGAGFSSGGSVFVLSTNGSGFAELHSFGTVFSHGGALDGGVPNTLIRLGDNLYSAAASGGGHGRGNVFGILLGLSATPSVEPELVHTGDTITVEVDVLNTHDQCVSNVQLAGPIILTGIGGVTPLGAIGPTNTPVLEPLDETTFTFLYTAASFGAVSFAAAASGVGIAGVVSSSYATSAVVNISPRGDLLIKTGAQPTNLYAGAGIYQITPRPPQVVTNCVLTNVVSTFDVEVVNKETSPMNYWILATSDNDDWSTRYLFQGEDVTAEVTNGVSLPTLNPGGTLTLVVNTTATAPDFNDIVFTLGLASDPSLTLDAVQAVSIAYASYQLPQLTINNNGASIMLGWPVSASGFILETNASLMDSTWAPAAAPMLTNDEQISLTMPASPSATFFRLAR